MILTQLSVADTGAYGTRGTGEMPFHPPPPAGLFAHMPFPERAYCMAPPIFEHLPSVP